MLLHSLELLAILKEFKVIYQYLQFELTMEAESDEQVEVKQHFKKGEKQKEIRAIGIKKDRLATAASMYEAANTYFKTFKTVKNEHPALKGLTIIDISLNMRGFQEDQTYCQYQFYRNNIRRGNTIIVDKTQNSKQPKVHWGRKGLIKFFDISTRSINKMLNIQNFHCQKKDRYIHEVVFNQIESIFRKNANSQRKQKVHVYRLNKANGQNAQVSYFQPTDHWVIASKNVSILVKDRKDLNLFDGARYSFAKLIAETWFNIVGDDEERISQLKKNIAGKTLIGQYCGNPEFQHLVKYAKTIIYFYAVVENDSLDSCIPPPAAFNLFRELGIPIVKNHEKSYEGNYGNVEEFAQALSKIFSDVACSSIFEQEEGSVVYFVLQSCVEGQKESKSRVVSLGKLKTMEYRFLRKLRQKLRSLTHKEKQGKNQQKDVQQDQEVQGNSKYQQMDKKFQQKYGSFEKECKELLGQEKLSKPIQYYFCVALTALQYCYVHRNNQSALQLLHSHYLDFLGVIFWCIDKKKQVTPDLMNDNQLIIQLRGQTWENYSVEIVQNYEQMVKQIAPKYWKVKKSLVDQNEGKLTKAKLAKRKQNNDQEKQKNIQEDDKQEKDVQGSKQKATEEAGNKVKQAKEQ